MKTATQRRAATRRPPAFPFDLCWRSRDISQRIQQSRAHRKRTAGSRSTGREPAGSARKASYRVLPEDSIEVRNARGFDGDGGEPMYDEDGEPIYFWCHLVTGDTTYVHKVIAGRRTFGVRSYHGIWV